MGRPDSSVVNRLVDAMVDAWRVGDRTGAEETIASHPGLGDEAAIRLIFEEFSLREEFGEPVDPVGFAQRFPRWQAELQALLDCHRLIDAAPRGASDSGPPRTGDNLAGFRLLAELGRGATGSVFLASQSELADRPVVLKVTPRGVGEHLSQARLQHMNIVPLYSALTLADRGLDVLCMPFLGGASLAQVFESIADRPASNRTGGDLVAALDRVHDRLPVPAPSEGPFRSWLARASYVDAICWVGACLADGLQYAHDRGLVHMDIKPSNVLLAGDGQPMLLDFHLARAPIVAGSPGPAWMGGTPQFMAPEQAQALDAIRERRPIPADVDGRADVYALGLLLDEALGGPVDGEALPDSLRARNPRVSVGLSDIVAKSRAADPADRYPDPAALAAELRRHLDDLPLRGVANRSLAERWRKWRRRSPASLPRGLVVIALVLLAAGTETLVSSAYRQRVQEIEAAMTEGRAAVARRDYPRATEALKRGLELARRTPSAAASARAIADELAVVRRDARAADLRGFVDCVRYRYGVEPPAPSEADGLIRLGRAIWGDRVMLIRPVANRSDPDAEAAIRADLLDFALAWSDLLVRSASPLEARTVLDEAESLLGSSPAIDRERAFDRGQPPPRDAAPPRTAWDHYQVGRSYLRHVDFALAADQFQRGLDLRPQDFWLNFHQGFCAYRLGRYEEAADAFRVCTALAPETAECDYNRALALASLGRTDQALAAYTRALDLSPNLTEAALNRGILRYRSGDLDGALSDLDRALGSTHDPATIAIIRYNRALIAMARGDRSAAVADLDAAVVLGHAEARKLRDQLGP